MKIKVDLDGCKRRRLAYTIGEAFKSTVNYKGASTHEYEVGGIMIGRDGTITLKPRRVNDTAYINRLLEVLTERGYEPMLVESDTPAAPATDNPPDEAVEEPQETVNCPRQLAVKVYSIEDILKKEASFWNRAKKRIIHFFTYDTSLWGDDDSC